MNKYLMIIDDDGNFTYLIKRICDKINISLLSASDGQEALDKLNDQIKKSLPIPDLMFVDINMPGMGGFEFLQEFGKLKGQHPILEKVEPIIMLTSSDQDRDKKIAAKLGVSRYVVKPNDMSDMERFVKEATIK